MERKIYVNYGSDARLMTIALLEAANISERIPKDANIGLKPNLVLDSPASQGATTHPEIAEGVIQYLQMHGFKKIFIMESSWVGASTDRAFLTCGYSELCKRYHIPFYDLKKDETIQIKTPIGPLSICKRAWEADYLINLPVLKGHCQTVMTCALKNCKGCIPDREKRRFHALGLHKPIAALAATLRPALTIVDSICGDLDFEEGGNPIQTQRIFMGEDPVQVDTYGCSLIGVDPQKIEYLALAQEFGAGSMDYTPEDIILLNSPLNDHSEGKIYHGKAEYLAAFVQQDQACSACYGSLIHALYRLQQQDQLQKLPHIYIGQGWRGKTLNGIGVGRCCAGAELHINGCPPSAQEILRVLQEWIQKDEGKL